MAVKRFLFPLVCAALCGAPALAAELEASATVGPFPFTVGLVLRDLALSPDSTLDPRAEFGVSTRAAFVGLSGAFDLGPVGRASASARLAYVYVGGLRLSAGVRGTFGPAALEARALYWTAPLGAEDPLAPYALEPDPATGEGYLVAANGSYRLSRELIVRLEPRLGSAASGLEARLETRSSELTLSGGGLVAVQANGTTLGAVAGARYSPEEAPFQVSADGLVGSGPDGFTYGLVGSFSLSLPDELGSATVYGAFEPWRLDVATLRAGLGLELNVGPGVAFARAQGGFGTWGVQLGYRLDLAAVGLGR